MRIKSFIILIIFLSVGVEATSQRIYPYLDIEINDYDIERFPKNSEDRYNAINNLINDVESKRSAEAEFGVGKMPEMYLEYIHEAQKYSITNKMKERIPLLKNHEFDHYVHYRSMIEGVVFANAILSDTLLLTTSFKMQLYSYLHTVYQDLGLYTEFIELFPKINALQKDLDPSITMTINQDADVARGYFMNKNYKAAIKSYHKALASLSKSPTDADDVNAGSSDIRIAEIHSGIGLAYGYLNQVDSSVVHFDRAVALLENSDNLEPADEQYRKYLKYKIETHKAEQLYAETEPEKVIPYALKTFHSFPVLLNPIDQVTTFNLLGRLYYDTGDYLQAKAYIIMAEERLRSGVNPQDHINNLKTDAQIFLVTGDKKRSAILFKEHERFVDSLAKVKSETRLAITLTAFDTQQKEVVLKRQQLQIASQEGTLQKQKQRQLLYFVIIVCLILLTAMGFLYIGHIKKQNEKIISQKIKLDKSLIQKELLLKEVHHRVKNNLQIISSLLEEQAGKSDDTAVKTVMQESQERIDAMALIHQQLYSSENFTHIDLKSYVNSLFEHLYLSNNRENVNIQHILNVNAEPVHIDVAVPFGIMLNELISNCYKYAFKNRTEGVITVSVESKNESFNTLTVSDNGVGLPNELKLKKHKSLGIKLVEGIAWQLRGNLDYSSSEYGSTFVVTFIKNLKAIPKHNEV